MTNQRETTILWEKASGRPVANAIVWQSRVSAGICQRLKAEGHEPLFRARTGLVLDAYFSGTKIKHLLDTLQSRRGEFRLIALPGGRTRLEGRTFYELSMAPQPYWAIFGDALIHQIHDRVLRHHHPEAQS